MMDQKQNEVKIIQTSRENSNAAILKGDAAGVAQYWMDDIIVISGEGGQYAGKKLLLKVFTEMFQEDKPVFERIPSVITIGDSGVLAWETGEWNYKTEKFRGNYSAMWRKIKGKWLTQAELFVSLD
ncbi:ketosteroid isomerase-like protein [Pedobacter cryoconitis]|uniref:Ketosteroid isomerase-like protein n=1 Tax=Pedobacter cryoconitis TaxID=188932 RepID=A0A7W8YTF5_9SPHI|nr:nuclear transport factor 2 family protein [Pedobacter cryoconitis]MBB5621447.1 ketosteroid isomerase-like protein [Pedobacter cryoconitis]MBB5643787.1 ketosteroid isomerase-like protein [Pedobacter cryoconitis]